MNFIQKWFESHVQFSHHDSLTKKEIPMSIKDTIAADQTALEAAKHTVDMAQAQLDADTLLLAHIQPQLDNYDALEAAVTGDHPEELLSLIVHGRSLLG